MVIDFKDDIVDEDGMLNYFSYKEKMKKFYPLMKKAKEAELKMFLVLWVLQKQLKKRKIKTQKK